MLTAKKIRSLFEELNSRLGAAGVRGEIGIVGGAAMCLVYKSRESTRDVDAVFEPADIIRELASQIAEDHDLGEDWLNDAVKGFMAPGFERDAVIDLPHLSVWVPEPSYILAMKCISARFDSHDGDDVRFLIRHLGLKKVEEAVLIVEKYYPKERMPAKTTYFLEEIFEKLGGPHPGASPAPD